jgi:predicted PurR-regulated permease PerM
MSVAPPPGAPVTESATDPGPDPATDRATATGGTHLLVGAAALVILTWGAYQARSVLVSLLVSIFFAILGTPPLLWLQRRRVPTLLGVLLVVSAMVLILLLAAAIVGASLTSFSSELPGYQERLHALVVALQAWLSAHGVKGLEKALMGVFNPGALMGWTATLLTELGLALSNILLVLLTIAFILLEVDTYPGKLRAVLGSPRQGFPQVTTFVGEIEHYVLIKTGISLATGVLVGGWLAILGVDFAVLWGFIAFLLNYVPSVGSTVAAIPAVLLALVQLGPGRAALAAGGYMTVNFILDNVIETRLMGRRLHLSTLVVFLSLIVWGGLLGPVGMVLCIPLTMTLKFACEQGAGTRWIAALLAPGVPNPPHRPASREPSLGG